MNISLLLWQTANQEVANASNNWFLLGSVIVLVLLAVILFFTYIHKLVKTSSNNQILLVSRGKKGQEIMRYGYVNKINSTVEEVDLSTKIISITLDGGASLQCKENIKVQVKITIPVNINESKEHIIDAIGFVGSAAATFDQKTVESRLLPYLVGAIKEAAKSLSYWEVLELSPLRNTINDELSKLANRTKTNSVQKTDSVQKADSATQLIYKGFCIGNIAIEQLQAIGIEGYDQDSSEDAEALEAISKRTVDANYERIKYEEEKATETAKIQHTEKARRVEEEAENQKRIAKKADELAEGKLAVAHAEALQALANQQSIKVQGIKDLQKIEEEDANLKEAQEQNSHDLLLKKRENEHTRQKKEQDQAVELATEKLKLEQQKLDEEIGLIKAQEAYYKNLKKKEQAEEDALLEKGKLAASREKAVAMIELEKKMQATILGVLAPAAAENQVKLEKTQTELAVTKTEREGADLKAETMRVIDAAENESLHELISNKNLMSNQQIAHDLLQELMPRIKEITEQLMKPAEKIDSIRVLNMNGLNGNGKTSSDNAFLQLLGSIVNTGAALPLISELIQTLKEDGKLTKLFNSSSDAHNPEQDQSDDFETIPDYPE